MSTASRWTIGAIAVVAAGCGGNIHSDSTMRVQLQLQPPDPPAEATGIRIGDETLKQFRAGETSEAWVIAVLGQPTSSAAVEGEPGTHVLRYSTAEYASDLPSILAGRSARSTATVYFVVTNGIVQKFWADRETERTIFGKEVEKKAGEKQGS